MIDARLLDEKNDGLSHRFRLGVDAGPVDAVVDGKLREIGRHASAPGFRPGRVPVAILRKQYGKRIYVAVVDRVAIDAARRLIAERKLKPSRRPVIHIDEEAASRGSVTFTLVLEVMPQVVPGPLDQFRLRQLRMKDESPDDTAQAHEHLRRQLFDALLSRHDFPVPDDLCEEEYKRIRQGYELEVGEAVDSELDTELRQIARRRVRLAILLAEIARTHNISIPRSEVEALVERQAERDPEHQNEIIDYYLDHPTALAELQSPLIENRVVEFLLAQSEVEVMEVSEEEFRRGVEFP